MAEPAGERKPVVAADWFNLGAPPDPERVKTFFEQYKLYVDTADKVSERRGAANTFLLTANTALITVYGLAAGKDAALSAAAQPWRWLMPLAGLLLCLTWFGLIRAYRALNTGKFTVIHEMEKRLPVRLFDLEWEYLQRGKTWLYTPLSHLEQIIPLAFGGVYLFLILQAAGLI